MTAAHRVLFVADVGGPATYHVGDEAMLAANLAAFRARSGGELDATVVSSDPESTAARYGVRGARRPWPSLGVASGEPDGPPQAGAGEEPAISALADSDALVISGGGNLNSTWPHLLRERIELLEAAARLGKTAVVLGQTLGPTLSAGDRRRLGAALSDAAFVGVRELDSFRLALHLGVPVGRLHYQLDDAFFLPGCEPDGVDLPDPPWAAVTLTGPPRLAADFKRPLSRIHHELGLPLVFLPHAAEPDWDERIGDALAEELGDAVIRLPVLDALAVRRITARAALVISNRYHPLVFAVAEAVPALGLYSDAYTRIKLRGALAHAGLQRWCIDQRLVGTSLFEEAILELWWSRDRTGAHLRGLRPLHELVHRRHWTMVDAALSGEKSPVEPWPLGAGTHALAPTPERRGWAAVASAMAEDDHRATWQELFLTEQRDEGVRYARSLKEVLGNREEELANVKRALEELRERVAAVGDPPAPKPPGRTGAGPPGDQLSESPGGGGAEPPGDPPAGPSEDSAG